MNIDSLTAFFGWAAIINIGVLLFTTAMVLVLREQIVGIHARLFNVDADYVRRSYFQYLAQFKIVTIVFSLVPYLVLKIIA